MIDSITLSWLFAYSVTAYGLAYIVGQARISDWFREGLYGLGFTSVIAMLECAACFGFWAGLICGAWVASANGLSSWWALGFAVYTSGSNRILYQLTEHVVSSSAE